MSPLSATLPLSGCAWNPPPVLMCLEPYPCLDVPRTLLLSGCAWNRTLVWMCLEHSSCLDVACLSSVSVYTCILLRTCQPRAWSMYCTPFELGVFEFWESFNFGGAFLVLGLFLGWSYGRRHFCWRAHNTNTRRWVLNLGTPHSQRYC